VMVMITTTTIIIIIIIRLGEAALWPPGTSYHDKTRSSQGRRHGAVGWSARARLVRQ
jgi:hypothetical protein